MANVSNANNGNNLLSPNAAIDGRQAAGGQQRRKSALSANGFFIDYSCTRRRSSAAVKDQQLLASPRGQLLRTYVSPVRWPSHAATGGQAGGEQACSNPSSPSRGRLSRTSLHPTSAAVALLPNLNAPAALAGSRKTSIFDPIGHSIASSQLVAKNRRKSTMVTGGAGLAGGLLDSKCIEPAGARLMSVAKSVCAAKVKGARKGNLAQHVPVIGCSPTSIGASLAALEESRRYEKLLRRLKRHQKRKEKRRRRALKRELEETMQPISPSLEPDSGRPLGALRRKSVLAIKGVAQKLNKATGRGRGRQHGEEAIDSLSMSSMSFISAASCASLPSLYRCTGGAARLSQLRRAGDFSSDEDDEDDDDEYAAAAAAAATGRQSNVRIDFHECQDHEGPNDNHMQDSRALPPEFRDKSASIGALADGHEFQRTKRRSVVGQALEKLTNRLGKSKQAAASPQHQERRKSKADAVQSMSSGMNYWYQYYYHLRESSIDPAYDDLPICSESGGALSEAERRSRLHINYSLNRIEILNSNSGDPVARLADKLARLTAAQEADQQQQQQQLQTPTSKLENLFDFSQESDLSLSLSTSTGSLSMSSDEGTDSYIGVIDGDQSSTSSGGSVSQCSQGDCDNEVTTSGSSSAASSGKLQLVASKKSLPVSSSSSPSRVRTNQRLPQRTLSSRYPRGPETSARLGLSGHSSSSQSVRICADTRQAPIGRGARDEPLHSSPSKCSEFDLTIDWHKDCNPSKQRPPDLANQSSLASQSENFRHQTARARAGGQVAALSLRQLHKEAREENNDAFNGPQSKQEREMAKLRDDKRSSSISSALASRAGTAVSGGDNEEELDDFERFNRCHRGYKLPESSLRDLLANGKHSPPLQQQTTSNKTIKLAGRPSSSSSSSFRFSFRSVLGSSSSWRERGSQRNRKSERSSEAKTGARISASWDTLAGGCSTVGSADESGQPLDHYDCKASRRRMSRSFRAVSREKYLADGTINQASSVSSIRRLRDRNDRCWSQAAITPNSSNSNNNNNCSSTNNNSTHPGEQSANARSLTVSSATAAGYCGSDLSAPGGPQLAAASSGISPSTSRLEVNLEPGRARSHSNIVNLAETERLGSQAVDNSGQLARPINDCPSSRLRPPSWSGGHRHQLVANNRRCTSASLRVPRQWRQSRQSGDDIIRIRADKFACPVCAASTDLAPATQLSGSALAVDYANQEPSSNGCLQWAIDEPIDDTGGATELRARAHSAGPGNGLGRQALQAAAISSFHRRHCQLHEQKGLATNQQRLEADGRSDIKASPDEMADRRASSFRQQRSPDSDQKLFRLLAKDCFTCMMLGSSQSGKRTIVKCLVKLLNEFKLAADEYKKEKMLAKLIDCSEKLQDLASQQQDAADEMAQCVSPGNHQPPRHRLNSWLGTSTVNRLLNFPSVSTKRRLNSILPNLSASPDHRLAPGAGDNSTTNLRRHTAIVGSYQLQSSGGKQDSDDKSRTCLLAPPTMRHDQPFNKSDFDISYTQKEESSGHSTTTNQLQVPSLESTAMKRNSLAASSNNRGSLQSCGSSVRRSIQLPLLDDASSSRLSRSDLMPTRPRNQSIQTTVARPITLRDLNKRRYRIRFRTRRQLSERYLIQSSGESTSSSEKKEPRILSSFPDLFLVVYSINDRRSFERASSFIGQLRSLKLGFHLPIVLVANKIDLERAKVIKSEEGRALARSNTCKFMEISCTVGFNLDNLLVGLRSQLVLKHHAELKALLQPRDQSLEQAPDSRNSPSNQSTKEKSADKGKGSENILMRFYKRCVPDNHGHNYDCDNFAKL